MGAASSKKANNSGPIFKTSKPAEKPVQGLKVYQGTFVHSVSWSEPCVITPNGVIGVKDGKIEFVDTGDNLESLKGTHSFSDNDITKLREGEFLMPGMIDTHIHAAQYPNAGMGLDLPLLEWLEKYTFPLESKYKDTQYAEGVYRKVVEKTLSHGTTTASYFTTIHTPSALVMADLVEAYGQRALIGKVCMDSSSPETLIETTEESLKETTEFVKALLDRKNPLVLPTVTPRFALSCTAELMKGLGDIAKEHDVHIQTHLSESLPEVQRVAEVFPDHKFYADVYASSGLLRSKSIMAHCVHLHDEEIETLKNNDTGISHCPNSNLSLLSGFCPVRKIRDAGVKIGLGTDVSGGYSPSMLDAMRYALTAAKARKIEGKEGEPLTYREAFFLATLGGAEALALEKEIGNFQVGKAFDALMVSLVGETSPVDSTPDLPLDDLLQKFIMLGDDRNIVKVFVNGQLVKSL